VEAGAVKTASFSADGQTLLTGGSSGTLSLYSIPDLRLMGRPLQVGNLASGGIFAWFGRSGQVEGYAPDLAKPQSDLRRWFTLRVDPASLVREACQVAGQDITPAQWQRYVGDRPYRRVCR
jgi:hypothetical protein